MLFSWWRRSSKRPSTGRQPSRPSASPSRDRTFRPGVECLEARLVPSGDAVIRWNTAAIHAVAVDHSGPAPSQGGPGKTARALAIVQLAVFDAVNAIDHHFKPFLLKLRVPQTASIDAAVSRAAHDTLIKLYPNQRATFDAMLKRNLNAIPDGAAEALGVLAGRAAARTCLKSRENDGMDVMVDYNPTGLTGNHDVDPLHTGQGFLGDGWGKVKGFGIASGAAFQAPPPPDLGSADYAAAFNEVKNLGGDGVTTPTSRTPEQTQIGIFWGYDGSPGLGTPPVLYNQISQVIARKMHNSVEENARLFGLINMAMADAGIAIWQTKYTFDFWRPVLGIRGGNSDGNAATVGDPTWKPLGAPADNGHGTNFTPNFPAYTSGHAGFGAALFRTLRDFYGRDNIKFTIGSDEFNGKTIDQNGVVRPVVKRTFHSFSQAAEENGQSRIYLGIHWKFDKEQGIAEGTSVADFIFRRFLRPR